MTMDNLRRSVLRFAAVAGLAGLTVACAGQPREAVVAPAGYGKDDVSRVERLVQYCERLADKGEYVTALGLCGRAHEIDPDNPDTLMKMASILTKLNRGPAAAQAYGVLLERHPGHQEARYNLGKLHMESGDTELAAMHFNQAITANPTDPRPYNALGILRDQAGEHQVAQSLYRSALEQDPRNLSARNNLGLSLALSGQRDEAIEVLAELAVDPDADQTVMRNLEVAYAASAPATDPAAADPAAAPAMADETLPPAGEPMARPAALQPSTPLPPGKAMPAKEPVEVKAIDSQPPRPRSLPARAPMIPAPSMGAPEVKAEPAPAGDGKPTPLYLPKPSAAKPPAAEKSGFEVRSLAARTEAPKVVPQVVKVRHAPPAATSGPSLIDSAVAELMKKPDWADFEPGSLTPSLGAQEASLERPAPPPQGGGGLASSSLFAGG